MRTSSAIFCPVLCLAVASAAVADTPKAAEAPPPPMPPGESPAPAAPTGAAAPAGAAAPVVAARFEITGLSAPESVLHDTQADIYLVTNINGPAFARDDNGFITRVAPSGEIVALKWIDGAKPGVELNAPKGMAILGDRLYVADIDTLRAFDRTTGAPKEQLKIAGATLLNDVAAGPASVFVSDTAIKEDFSPSGDAAIYEIRDGKVVRTLARGGELKGPNGLATRGQELWAVTLGGNELYRIGADGRRADVTKIPQGQLDGLVILADGTFLVSSWQASTVYMGRPGSDFTIAIADLPSPADIGFDAKRSRLLIPEPQKDIVAAFDWAAPRTRMGRAPAPDRTRRP